MISGKTRIAAVLGWPIDHTRSPVMMNAAFAAAGIDAALVPIGVPPHGFAAAIEGLRASRMLGASVTVPHKLAAVALCDELSPAATAIGAVNCLVLEGTRLVGHNTDCLGFADALAAASFDVRGRRCVLLGAGGAARAVAYGLRAAESIDVIARRPADVSWARALEWSHETLRDAFAHADLVIDCTPAGLEEIADTDFTAALPIDALGPHAWIVTLVYHRRTKLLERASERGHSTLDGRAMLVHQGARAFRIWTGQPAPIEVMTRALDDDLR
ncbi:MAG: shikimate 5-dehydrogenase [Myxococcales bacterium]|nr:shikimate 5-dehydrogenase [Myxococcales bacterium]